jgi:hypothetical protein
MSGSLGTMLAGNIIQKMAEAGKLKPEKVHPANLEKVQEAVGHAASLPRPARQTRTQGKRQNSTFGRRLADAADARWRLGLLSPEKRQEAIEAAKSRAQRTVVQKEIAQVEGAPPLPGSICAHLAKTLDLYLAQDLPGEVREAVTILRDHVAGA